MTAKNILTFFGILIVIAGVALLAIFGLSTDYFEIPNATQGIKLGLDLRGGSVITFEAEPSQVNPDTLDDDMEIVKALITQRLSSLNYTEAAVYKVGTDRIRVEIPDVEDPEEAVALVGKTANLTFRDADGNILFDGSVVEDAKAKYGPTEENGMSVNYVELTFKKESRSLWVEATKVAAQRAAEEKNQICIYLDEEMVFNPTVAAEYATTGIDSDKCTVTFGGSGETAAKEANEFADLIRIGKLPFKLNQVELRSVGPTLGERSLQTSLMAGAIGLGLVILFMIIYYRVPGIMAGIALIFYTAAMAFILSIVGVNLSLPGIAGIILSIGMAVDANVIIFERIKEELRAGKTIRSAIDAGFKRALAAIVDSNITTIIAAIVLMVFGTGPIQGFANTLLIGVLLSMFTVLVVSRFLLKLIADMGVKSIVAFGVSKSVPKTHAIKFSFVKRFTAFALIAVVLVATGVVAVVALPFGGKLFNFDIDFVGGTTFHIAIHKELSTQDLSDITSLVTEASGVTPSAPQKTGENNDEVIIKMSSINSETREKVFVAIKDKYGLADADRLNVEDVGSTVGKDLRNAAVTSVLLASILILIYITIRFQFSSGVAAVVALVNDLLVMLTAYVVLQIPINMTFIAAMLTILGYSINATIIVFDRVRENRRLLQKEKFANIVDISIRQTLARSINTTLTTLFPIVMLIIFGVPSVRDFAIPLVVGILSGAFSSICLSGGLWVKIRGKKEIA